MSKIKAAAVADDEHDEDKDDDEHDADDNDADEDVAVDPCY